MKIYNYVKHQKNLLLHSMYPNHEDLYGNCLMCWTAIGNCLKADRSKKWIGKILERSGERTVG